MLFRSHSPWPGAGPGTPVGLGVGLEALESSLAGAGVGIVPDGEVGLQPREMRVGAEGQLPGRRAHTAQAACPPQCRSMCFGKTVFADVRFLSFI